MESPKVQKVSHWPSKVVILPRRLDLLLKVKKRNAAMFLRGRRHQELVEQRKNHPTFHYTGWLIGILIMAYYNP